MISYKIALIFLMYLMHYIEDFHLQGCLANLKQKKWWVENVSRNLDATKYRKDYTMGLLAHSIENALFVMAPLIVDLLLSEHAGALQNTWFLFIPATFALAMTHYSIDDAKANLFKINLIQDQVLHIICIALVAGLYFPAIGAWL